MAQGGEETLYDYYAGGEASPGQLEQVTTAAGATTYTWDNDTGLLDSLTDPLTALPTTLNRAGFTGDSTL